MNNQNQRRQFSKGWHYWLIRDQRDNPIELVRANTDCHLVIAGEGKGMTQHKHSQYFTNDHLPDLKHPVSFELLHAGDASSPAVSEAINQVESFAYFRKQKTRKRKQYGVKDAKDKAIDLLLKGSSIREAATLCGVPKSTVADWSTSQLSESTNQ